MVSENLKKDLIEVEILNEEQLNRIKNYIAKKYSHLDKHYRANILADTIHQICDKQLYTFKEEQREEIKRALFLKAAETNTFVITGGDILNTCLALGENDGEIKTNLVTWLHQEFKLEEAAVTSDSQFEKAVAVLREKNPISFPWSFEPTKIHKKYLSYVCIFLLIVLAALNPLQRLVGEYAHFGQGQPMAESKARVHNELPSDLQYKTIDQGKLKAYLQSKNSLLAEDKYLLVIVKTAEEFNINPLLIFAIAGQEQGFVPKHHPKALNMVNNPFNVFYSWQDYNTNLEDTTRIVARTLTNLSKNRPEHIDPLVWINRKYAEDNKWWEGVSFFLKDLEQKVNN